MGRSSETEQIRRRLAGAVRRKAFESYVRRGHVPEGVVHLAEIAADERKFIDFGNALSVTSRPDGRPTAYMARLVARYPGATIFMFQVIPRERPSP